MDEYKREFIKLAHYARDEVSTDTKKKYRFCKGPNPILKHMLLLLDFTTFEDLINKAIKAE